MQGTSIYDVPPVDSRAVPALTPSYAITSVAAASGGTTAYTGTFTPANIPDKLIQGAAAAIAGLSLPYFTTWFWFRVTNPSASAGLLQLFGPSVIVAIGSYFALMRWHAGLSNFTVDILTEEMVADQYGEPKARWEQVTVRVCQVIGVVIVLLLILGSFGRGR